MTVCDIPDGLFRALSRGFQGNGNEKWPSICRNAGGHKVLPPLGSGLRSGSRWTHSQPACASPRCFVGDTLAHGRAWARQKAPSHPKRGVSAGIRHPQSLTFYAMRHSGIRATRLLNQREIGRSPAKQEVKGMDFNHLMSRSRQYPYRSQNGLPSKCWPMKP